MSTHSAIHRASIHRPAGHWPKEKAFDTLTLDSDARHRRRIRLTTDQREEILLDLPKAVAMAHGDGLRLDDGRWLKIQAAPEHLVEIRHRDPSQRARLAWHLGNRHLPTEIQDQVLRMRHDHVIEDMLRRFGADLVNVCAPFQPEGGAYGHAHNHSHHEHDDDHDR